MGQWSRQLWVTGRGTGGTWWDMVGHGGTVVEALVEAMVKVVLGSGRCSGGAVVEAMVG